MKCFGDDYCFSLAFGVSGMLLVISLGKFLSTVFSYSLIKEYFSYISVRNQAICKEKAIRKYGCSSIQVHLGKEFLNFKKVYIVLIILINP